MHAVVPLSWCRHLEFSEQMLNTVPEGGLNHLDPCLECGNVGENWVCLNCYEVRLPLVILKNNQLFSKQG